MDFRLPDIMSFEKPSQALKPLIENETELKKAFGSQLGLGKQSFDAACEVCGSNTAQALYISQHWLNDPVVLAAKEIFIKTVHNSNTLLDAEELAAKLLQMANEKNASNTFYLLEGKDRLKALELYAKVRGFDKSVAPTTNITFKQMVVKFVEPKKEEKIIDQLPDNEANELKKLIGMLGNIKEKPHEKKRRDPMASIVIRQASGPGGEGGEGQQGD